MSSPLEMPIVPSKSLGQELSHRRRRRQQWPVMGDDEENRGRGEDKNAATLARDYTLKTHTQHARTHTHTHGAHAHQLRQSSWRRSACSMRLAWAAEYREE